MSSRVKSRSDKRVELSSVQFSSVQFSLFHMMELFTNTTIQLTETNATNLN